MGNEISTGDPIPYSVIAAVLSVRVLDTAATCVCAAVCRDWNSLAVKPSSHSGVIVFKHCLLRKRIFRRSVCDCHHQLILKIVSLSLLRHIVLLDICGVHLSHESLEELGQNLRLQGIRPQQFRCSITRDTWRQKFLPADVVDCHMCSFIYHRVPLERWSLHMFITVFDWSEEQTTDIPMLSSLIEKCWNSMPLNPPPLPDREDFLTLLDNMFGSCSGKPFQSDAWSFGDFPRELYLHRSLCFYILKTHNVIAQNFPNEWRDHVFSFCFRSRPFE